MSAVREVKYLRELHHPNIIEVHAFRTNVLPRHSRLLTRLSLSFRSASCFVCLPFKALGCVLFEDESEPRPRVPRHRPRDDHQGPFTRLSPGGHQKLDGHDVPWSGILSPEFHPPSSACGSFSPYHPVASWRSILLLRLSCQLTTFTTPVHFTFLIF